MCNNKLYIIIYIYNYYILINLSKFNIDMHNYDVLVFIIIYRSYI